jgi:serine phosphatase RsbU (regulator of sigma subunit)
VAERTEEINTQKEQILLQNNKLTDSLKYALNIQEAILPDSQTIEQTWPEHFVFYQPKDTVSGDFYWYKRIENDDFNVSVIAVADCTGHGVPGAFMSMLGVAFLNDIVIQKEVKTSSDILNSLRNKMLETLGHQGNGKSISDGMDLSLVVVNHDTHQLQYSGAMRFMYLLRNNELFRINGDRMPIGKFIKDTTPFTHHELTLEHQDTFYLFTDGFADQMGGADKKKYLRKNLRQLLLTVHQYPSDVQHEIVERAFFAWKNQNEQTDDILLAGFKYLLF